MIESRRRRKQEESGFALLLVFLMAASISIMLYMQLPRAAFEAQRGKEELLQDRGDQYIRAIQLYVAKWKRYPPDWDALEKTNNVRFLRKRYKDPMTGKDEWRAVHVDGAGQLTDSIVQKQETKKEATQVFVSELPTVGSAGNVGGEAGQNVALRRRPSDNNVPGANMGGPGGLPPDVAQSPVGNQAYVPPQPPSNQPPGNDQQPNQQLNGQLNQQVNQQGNQPQPVGPNTGQPQPGMFPPGVPQPGVPGTPPFPQQGNMQQQPAPMMPNAGYPSPGPNGFQRPAGPTAVPNTPGGPPGPQNAGLDMINRILTTPRANVNMNIPGATGLQIGGGIAGFASTYEAPSIKVYNERQKYNEWEFIYDIKKDKRLLGAAAGGGVPQNNNPLGGLPPGAGASPNPGNIPNPIVPPPNPQGNPNQFGPQTPAYSQPGRR